MLPGHDPTRPVEPRFEIRAPGRMQPVVLEKSSLRDQTTCTGAPGGPGHVRGLDRVVRAEAPAESTADERDVHGHLLRRDAESLAASRWTRCGFCVGARSRTRRWRPARSRSAARPTHAPGSRRGTWPISGPPPRRAPSASPSRRDRGASGSSAAASMRRHELRGRQARVPPLVPGDAERFAARQRGPRARAPRRPRPSRSRPPERRQAPRAPSRRRSARASLRRPGSAPRPRTAFRARGYRDRTAPSRSRWPGRPPPDGRCPRCGIPSDPSAPVPSGPRVGRGDARLA